MDEIASKVRLRDAGKEDVTLVASCVLAAVDAYDFVSRPEEFDSILAVCAMDDTLYSYRNAIVATVDDIPIGCLVAYPGDDYLQTRKHTFEVVCSKRGGIDIGDSDPETGLGEYYLDSLALVPQYRGHEIGKILLRAGLEKARRLGCRKATLIAEVQHSSLRKYYASLGFKERGKVRFFGEDYVKMELTISNIDEELKKYIETSIIPMYDHFDAGHGRDHAQAVISQAAELSQYYDVDENMVYTAAAYHDTGLRKDRATHHLESGKIIREDSMLRKWFTPEQIETIAQAAEDHRASSDHEPRSIYGRIIAEADRQIVPETVIRRCIQYGLSHCPELDREGQWLRTKEHLVNKYGDGGYLKLWIPESPNAARLAELRSMIRDEKCLRGIFEKTYDQVVEP